jgi:hypothetical protein
MVFERREVHGSRCGDGAQVVGRPDTMGEIGYLLADGSQLMHRYRVQTMRCRVMGPDRMRGSGWRRSGRT